jgi:hypothetical protein
VNLATAQSEGLVSVSGSNFTMGVDHTKIVPDGTVGRNSVRIESVKKWLHHVSMCARVLYTHGNLLTCDRQLQCGAHAAGLWVCVSMRREISVDAVRSTWPAIWEVGQSWETDGEVGLPPGIR